MPDLATRLRNFLRARCILVCANDLARWMLSRIER